MEEPVRTQEDVNKMMKELFGDDWEGPDDLTEEEILEREWEQIHG